MVTIKPNTWFKLVKEQEGTKSAGPAIEHSVIVFQYLLVHL